MSPAQADAGSRQARANPWTTFVFAALIASAAVATPQIASSTETCGTGFSGLQIIEPDEDSGIGGTGASPPSAESGPLRTPSTSRSDGSEHTREDRGSTRRAGDESESGIGGTGQRPTGGGGDESGIGGTGIYGPVSRSERLCVNGLRIAVPESLAIEGATNETDAGRLAIGQIVFVDALATADGLLARRIVRQEGLAGRIEVIRDAGRELIVSGRRVRLDGDVARSPDLDDRALRAGEWIVVHGLVGDRGQAMRATRLEAGDPGETRPGGSLAGRPLSAWLESMRAAEDGLAYVAMEGIVAGSHDRPRLGGIEIARDDRSTPDRPSSRDAIRRDAIRSAMRPGQRVRLGGRIARDATLRVEAPPRWLVPERSPRPESRAPDIRPRGIDGPSESSTPHPRQGPTPKPRPTPETKPRPPREIDRPPRPEIERPPTRPRDLRPDRDVLPPRPDLRRPAVRPLARPLDRL